MPTILVIGFSHLGCLIRAAQARSRTGVRGAVFQFLNLNLSERHKPFFDIEDGTVVYRRTVLEDIDRLLQVHAPDLVALSLWSNQNFIFGTFNHPRPFDFILPDEPDLALLPDAEIVPYDLALAQMHRHCAPAAGLLAAIRPLAGAPMVSLSAPPPIRDLDNIKLGSNIVPLAPDLRRLGFAPPSFRYKTWKLCQHIFSRDCAGAHSRFLSPPQPSLTTDGFRAADHIDTDWLHASTGYGEQVLQQLTRCTDPGADHDRTSIQAFA